MNGRLIIDGPCVGVWNMAVDESLLRSAAESATWTLRFYRWSSPMLSLGYFQEYAGRQLHVASSSAECVRRSTGGGAIVHDHELTYSLACPASDRWSRDNEALYTLVHVAICDSLAEQGIAVELFSEQVSSDTGDGDNRHEPFLCFQRRTNGDIIFKRSSSATRSDYKVCGSAQRRHKNAVLQHGSLIFRTSNAAPEIDGLLDLSRAELNEPEFLQSLTNALQPAFGVSFQPAGLTSDELQQARGIQKTKFESPDWTRKR